MFQIAQGILALALCVPTGMFDSLVIFSFKSQSNYLAYSYFEEDNAMDSRQNVQPELVRSWVAPDTTSKRSDDQRRL